MIRSNIAAPEVPLQLPLAYFFGVVVLLGAVLFLVPISKLRIFLRIMFAFLYCWGLFILLGLSLPLPAASLIAIAAGLVWFFRPIVWLHNLLMIFAIVSVGLVFGLILPPLSVIILLLVMSIYDLVAVRLGYMLWLTKKLSESDNLPAFIIPKKLSFWNLNLKAAGFRKLIEGTAAEREFSILGGGDIGFPLILTVSVFMVYGFSRALIVAVFSLVGLIAAYWIQLRFLKGKPMPALPPIFLTSLVGFLVVRFVI
ncbi:MAG: presenilin family intramembrane aspartyl protease [Chloroflexota bacterium]